MTAPAPAKYAGAGRIRLRNPEYSMPGCCQKLRGPDPHGSAEFYLIPGIGSEYFVSATSVNTGIFYVVVMKSFSFNAALKNLVRLSFLIIDNHNH